MQSALPVVASRDIQLVYDWGVRARMELIPTARKVYRDFALLAGQEPEGAAIMAALERLLGEAERWRDRSVGVGPEKGPHPEPLPQGVDCSYDEIVNWSKANSDLFEAVNQLGTYCHFHLKERRRSAAAREDAAEPLLSPDEYQELKRKNSLLNNLEILLGRTSLESYPLEMELDPTNECNLRCRGCRHGITKDFHHIEMRREYIEILSEAFPFVDTVYPLGTGEPTMSSTLPLLIREAVRHNVKVDLLTNGVMLEKLDLPWNALHRLGISIDGASEETMRALRPVAPLAHVLRSIETLRAKAPRATIYVKVTVSRMNYDELSALVEKLADAGVNEVICHSLEVFHPVHEAIQVRISDRAHMAECVEAARETAARRGMLFSNVLNFDAAARSDGDARDKNGMFQLLKESPLPILRIRELSTVLEGLESTRFTYYPEALLRAARLTPPEAEPAVSPDRAAAIGVDTIDRVIQERIQQARSLTSEQVRVPYCFLPWRMPIVDPDGRARACCLLPGHLGDLDHGAHFQDLWSGPGFVQLRESMFHIQNLPDVCAGCDAYYRAAHSAETLALADLLAIPIRQAPRHPAPMDVGGVLRSTSRSYKRRFETLGDATEVAPGRFSIAPGAQILARFPNPKTAAGVYYQGKFRFSGGQLLVGIKPVWGYDLWHYTLDSWYTSLLGEWVSLPMPPLPLNFAPVEEKECCLFLWAPHENSGNVEVTLEEFSGIATAPGRCHGDGLLTAHFWSGNTAVE
jgi:MoaA/NifB/PqqE/SkfB family radical SAM enzyme